MFEYKGYTGAIDIADTETGWFTGSIVGIQDVVTFEGKTIPALQKAFRESVEDYLEFCHVTDETAEKPYSGKFVLRLAPELHRRVSEAARAESVSLNSWICTAVENQLHKASQNGDGMPFEDIERLAHCVAAILAEKQSSRSPQPLAEKRRSKPPPSAKGGTLR